MWIYDEVVGPQPQAGWTRHVRATAVQAENVSEVQDDEGARMNDDDDDVVIEEGDPHSCPWCDFTSMDSDVMMTHVAKHMPKYHSNAGLGSNADQLRDAGRVPRDI
jgi:hypothetical protein